MTSIDNPTHGIADVSQSTLILDRLMDLDCGEAIPDEIYKAFQKKFPNKKKTDLRAYIAGYRCGLGKKLRQR